MENKPIKGLNTTDLISNQKLICNPDLIKVQTMKKKFISQIEEMDWADLVNLNHLIIGRVRSHVIMMNENGNLLKANTRDQMTWLRMKAMDKIPEINGEASNQYMDEIQEEADLNYYRIPQLFED